MVAAATVVVIVLVLLLGVWLRSTRSASSSGDQAAALFGFDHTIADLMPRPGQWVAVGTRGDDVWVGGAVLTGASWHVRQLASKGPLAVFGGCNTQTVDDLVPGSRALVLNCIDGGTARIGSVVVAGSPPTGEPGSILAVSCGVTHAEAVGGALEVSSAEPKGGAIWPSPEQPTFRLRWLDGVGLVDVAYKHADGLFSWFCPAPGTSRDPTTVSWNWKDATSAIGPVKSLGPVVFAHGDQCDELANAWWANRFGPGPTPIPEDKQSTHPIATALGLAAPPSERDWYYTCTPT